ARSLPYVPRDDTCEGGRLVPSLARVLAFLMICAIAPFAAHEAAEADQPEHPYHAEEASGAGASRDHVLDGRDGHADNHGSVHCTSGCNMLMSAERDEAYPSD